MEIISNVKAMFLSFPSLGFPSLTLLIKAVNARTNAVG